MPKISLIIPLEKEDYLLPFCLESVLHSSFQDLEILLVISEESSLQSIETCRTLDTRFKIMNFKEKGFYEALNLAIQETQGDYLSFMRSCDRIDPYFLQELWESANALKINLTRSDLYLIESNEEGILQSREKAKLFPDLEFHEKKDLNLYIQTDLLMLKWYPIWGTLYKKSFLENHFIAFQDRLDKNMVDFIFWQECLFFSEHFLAINIPLYSYEKKVQEPPLNSIESLENSFELYRDLQKRLNQVNPEKYNWFKQVLYTSLFYFYEKEFKNQKQSFEKIQEKFEQALEDGFKKDNLENIDSIFFKNLISKKTFTKKDLKNSKKDRLSLLKSLIQEWVFPFLLPFLIIFRIIFVFFRLIKNIRN